MSVPSVTKTAGKDPGGSGIKATGAKGIDGADAGDGQNFLRQANTMLGLIPCRRATRDTEPNCDTSAKIASFSSSDRRRRGSPLMISKAHSHGA
jgi:hypothetical protein